MSCNVHAEKHEISMICEWVIYGTQKESFVFNLDDKKVYWVNENKRLSFSEINEGRIVFEGIRSSLLMENNKYIKNVKLKFIINRVTGDLTIQGIKTPPGYNKKCIVTRKII